MFCLYVCACACWVPSKARAGLQIGWHWSSGWLCVELVFKLFYLGYLSLYLLSTNPLTLGKREKVSGERGHRPLNFSLRVLLRLYQSQTANSQQSPPSHCRETFPPSRCTFSFWALYIPQSHRPRPSPCCIRQAVEDHAPQEAVITCGQTKAPTKIPHLGLKQTFT